MEGNNFEKRKEGEKKEMESTPQESEVMNRYVDLRAEAYTASTRGEREAFEREFGDLINILNTGEGISPDFREEMRKQVHSIGEGYLTIKNATEAVERLKHESRGGVLVPHLYDRAAVLIKCLLKEGYRIACSSRWKKL